MMSDIRSGRMQRVGDVAYFTSDDGDRFRAYDCAYGPPQNRPQLERVMPLEDSRANYRY